MGWFSRRHTTLDDIGDGADVRLAVVVASPDALESTIYPTRAAAFRFTLLTQHAVLSSPGGVAGRMTPFATGWRGGPIVVRAACGRTIDVSLDQARLDAAFDPEEGVTLGDSPGSARAYDAYLDRAPASSVVFVREHAIESGESLVLVARVVPVAAAQGYREAATTRVSLFRTEGEVLLEEPPPHV